ncbi:MAG: glucose-1-phosphate adenylyltransferase, partial [Actinobacteria bacterium]|nr:glucose-1-phosphate adenylyltransferase [Actinomycetota bacterium]
LSDVWVVQQYQPVSISDHLANGRPWDLDRSSGGLMVLHPFQSDDAAEEGFHEGTADALHRNARFIREFDPDVLLVMSADHISTLDLRDLVDRHRESDGDVTMVTTRARRDDPSRFGVVEVDDSGRITSYERKPDEPASDVVTTEVFAFTPDVLLDALDQLADDDRNGDNGLEDVGDELLPMLTAAGRAWELRLPGYWRDVGTVPSYWDAHMQLLSQDDGVDLHDAAWPIRTAGLRRPPAHVARGASVSDSLLSPGCSILGAVERSVVGPGVVVEAGAVVRDSILLTDAVVSDGAVVETAIVDAEARIGAGARVGARWTSDDVPPPEHVTVVGWGASVSPGAQVQRGSQLDAADPRR